jgi:hypothetical protein
MNKPLLALTASLLSLGALTAPAHAGDRGDKVAAAIGGFIGGVIVGSHLDRNACPPPGYVDHRPPHSGGYWDTVTTRVWVPARWVMTYDSCGRRIRAHVPGYYELRHERVWVEAPRHRRYAGRW